MGQQCSKWRDLDCHCLLQIGEVHEGAAIMDWMAHKD